MISAADCLSVLENFSRQSPSCHRIEILITRSRLTVVLTLSRNQFQLIQAHAESTYPEECCGLLLGKISTDTKTLVKVQATENTWSPEVAQDCLAEPSLTKSHRYWIAPEAMLAGMRYARETDLEIIGIYHSHPDHPAIPSECDRQYAWTQYSYIIVSVHQGKAVDVRSWSLDDEQQFQPEALRMPGSGIISIPHC